MTITQATLYSYHLPLARTLILKGQPHIFRDGLLIRLTDEAGRAGWGEIAPLPGFSRETLEDAHAQARAVLSRLKEINLTDAVTGFAPETAGFGSLHASVRCGCEMALLHLAAERGNTSVAQFLGASTTHVSLNGLLIGKGEEVLTQTSELVALGYSAVKLKVGTRSLDDDIALVYRVHARLDGKAALRLDANRAWSLEQALHFGKLVEACSIEYIEEPLEDPAELEQLGKLWTLPLALDESIVDLTPEAIQPFDNLRAIILKPTLIGGFGIAVALAKRARELGIKAVISSSFESAVGLAHMAHLAAALDPDTAAGLDTSGWFRENLLEQSLPVRGALQMSTGHTLPSEIRTSLLTEVAHA